MNETVVSETVIVGVVPQAVLDVVVSLEETFVVEEVVVAEPQVSVVEVYVPEVSVVTQSNLNETEFFCGRIYQSG